MRGQLGGREFTYIDPKTGKRHDLQRRGQSKAHARDLVQALLRDIDATEGQGPLSERKTFAELCDYFEKHYVKAAEYVDGRKVADVRSLGTAKGQLNVLRDYFDASRLRSITHGDVRQFRATGSHLKAILICTLDTGMRQGEIFSLRWRDVDLEDRLLNIQAFHTKTMKERQVAITTRLMIELEKIKPEHSTIGTAWCLVFLTTSNEVSRQHEVKPA